MIYEFKLPDIGEGLHEAEIIRWLIREGDVVKADQPIAEIQTDKAMVEMTTPVAGKVVALAGPERGDGEGWRAVDCRGNRGGGGGRSGAD